MDATPKELRDTDLGDAFRGYNRDEVDELLDRAAATIERMQETTRQLGERVELAEGDAGRGRETEDMLHRTLLLAQRAADDAVAEARARAAQMVEEAEARSRSLLSEAESSARRVADAAHKRLSAEVSELTQRRDTLQTDVDALERFSGEYRQRLRSMVEADLEAISVDNAPRLPARPTMSSAEDNAPSTPESWTPPPPPAPSFASYDAPAADERPEASAASPPQDSDATAAPETPIQHETLSTMSYAALSEPRPDAPAAGGRVSEPPSADGTPALDDDAFFASLRDAVRDETPLGAEGENSAEGLYDQDSRRDDAGSKSSSSGAETGTRRFRRNR